ncbi:DUF6090 family protein [Geojedonia litorea]|uniref:DUF6090 family protein n=1 Tax=Geojedonia litorea TaxID=1268269 RepID=A0ABV9MZ57_9FLAO
MENKTGQYFKYAMGEIFLVVIGILIALNINNWNEDRKLNIEEISILKDIHTDLKASAEEIKRNMDYNTDTALRARKIINHLTNDLPYSSELDSAFGKISYWSSPYLTFSAYEALKNKGLDIIKDDQLKKDIVNMYESEFAYLSQDYDRSEWVLAQSVVYPITNKHIRRDLNSVAMAVPNDFESLKTNNEFINMLHTIVRFREGGIDRYKLTQHKLDNLISAIDKALK